MYKATIYHFIDLDNSKKDHKSIGGGIATHSFYEVNTISRPSFSELKQALVSQYGIPYDFCDNSLYFGIPESEWAEKDCPENFEAIIEEVNSKPLDLTIDLFNSMC